MRTLLRRLQSWLRFRRLEADLREELQFHRVMTRERLDATAASPTDAERASHLALGNITLAVEDARAVWISRLLDDLARDVRHALRLIRRQPGFSALTIATLAIGIGAVTTVVSILQAEVWRPLPFSAADRLVSLAPATRARPDQHGRVSVPEFFAIRSHARALDGVAAFRWNESRVVTGGSGAERVSVGAVTTDFFDVLRIPPALGRVFQPAEGQVGAEPVVILTHDFWQRYFKGSPTAVEQTIDVDGRSHAVVGILPRELRLEFIPDSSLYVPIAGMTADAPALNAIARLRPRVALVDAERELRPIFDDVLDSSGRMRGRHLRVYDLKEAHAGSTWRTYLVFLVAAGGLFLAACANVANLLLGRGVARRAEFVLRAALGGSRGRLIRQLLVEALLLACAAGAAGLGLAALGVDAFVAFAPAEYFSRGAIGLDLKIGVFAIALAAVACGLLPARQTPRTALRDALAGGSRRLGGDPGHRRLRSALVAAEVTLAFLLLASAGILTNSFVRLNAAPLGFAPDNIRTFRALLRGERYQDPRQLTAAHAELAARLIAVPGVTGVALANAAPLTNGDWKPFVVAGRPVSSSTEPPHVTLHVVTPEYLDLLGIRRVAGRPLTQADVGGSPQVGLINLNMARHFFSGEDPIGRRLTLLPGGSLADVSDGDVEIVGVVENTKEVGINEVPFDSIYLPLAQNPLPVVTALVGMSTGASGTDGIREAVRAFDANVPVYAVSTMNQRVAEALRSDRFNFLIVACVAGLAVLLAAIGVYGATAYDTARRTPEFGLRLALGAGRGRILGIALGHSLRLAALGIGLGLAIALVAARLIGDGLYLVRGKHNGLVYGVHLSDPSTLAIACALLITFAAIAAWVPARRATLVDPMIALREW